VPLVLVCMEVLGVVLVVYGGVVDLYVGLAVDGYVVVGGYVVVVLVVGYVIVGLVVVVVKQ